MSWGSKKKSPLKEEESEGFYSHWTGRREKEQDIRMGKINRGTKRYKRERPHGGGGEARNLEVQGDCVTAWPAEW